MLFAALDTFIGQGLSCIVFLLTLLSKYAVKSRKRSRSPSPPGVETPTSEFNSSPED
ncbi:hypothetical protein [Kamptonema sp. UHCC 0994]|uniref:hypothetical protein n=1 Tax=Kamptonema sp. UHCC 0994 TaxID=3031329 RepID=UPI0023B986B9|nr:hypothetical protein [Kamptonema sp. UHCC 0994]MDF0555121.1 hypothetical protein [Kamptonema sp. UHCC 0994]